MWKIAAIGECMLELSNPGAQPLQRNMPLQFSYGGDTLNTSVYLARLGVSCSYVTALGDDPYSDWLLKEWQAEDIDTAMVEILPGRNPGLYMIQTDANGERCFYYWRQQAPVRDLFKDKERVQRVFQHLADCDLVYLSGITLSLYDKASLQTLWQGLQRFRSGGGRIAFDGNYRPAGWASPQLARDTYQQFCNLATLALPTFDDEAALFGDSSPEQCAQRLHRWGIKEVVVKRGAEGAFTSSVGEDSRPGNQQWISAGAVARVVDSTAAGDSFNAGYLAARARGMSAELAAATGNQLAGRVIQYPGAIVPPGAMPALELSENY